MRCSDCKYWQCPDRLRDTREWSDCNYVISTLIPNFYELKTRFGFNLSVPFSPHDTKYVVGPLGKPQSCKGIKVQKRKEKDIWFDDLGNERTRIMNYTFYMTHKDYYCGCEEEM